MFPLLLNVKTPLRFILDVIVVGTCLNPLVNARAVYIPGRDEVAKEIVSASYVNVKAVAEGTDTALFCNSNPQFLLHSIQ